MKLAQEQVDLLNKPLPGDAIKPPNERGLSSIKSIYVTERLNEVFGPGAWQIRIEKISTDDFMQSTKNGERKMFTGTVKTTMNIPSCDIHYECIASSNNDDVGDALKGAITDSITKIASWMGIGATVYKGLAESDKTQKNPTSSNPAPQAVENEYPCPKCGSPLRVKTTKNGKTITECSKRTWSPELGPQGCEFMVWGPYEPEEDYPLPEEEL